MPDRPENPAAELVTVVARLPPRHDIRHLQAVYDPTIND